MEKQLATNELVEQTKALIGSIKRNYLAISINLYKLHKAWTGTADSWVDFYEQELELSKSQVSKMLKVGRFLELRGISPETDVSYEKLYLSINRNPDKEPEYIVSEAQTWGEDDYKAAKKEECKNPKYVTIELCENCHATKEKHV